MTLDPADLYPQIVHPLAKYVGDVVTITDDPNDLKEGQLGIEQVDAGSRMWYRPIAAEGQPTPDPIPIPINRARYVELVGTVDGVNDTFTIPVTPEGDVIPFRNGLAAWSDYTIDGDQITFDEPPTVDGDGIPMVLTALVDADSVIGPFVASFNGRSGAVLPAGGDYASNQITDNSTVGEPNVEASLTRLKELIDSGGGVKAVTVANYETLDTDRILKVTYSGAGDCTIEIQSSFIAAEGTPMEIHNQRTTGQVVITTEGSELISGYDDYVLAAKGNIVQLRMMGTYIAEIGSVS